MGMAVETSPEGSVRSLLRPSSTRPGKSADAPGTSFRPSKVAQPRPVRSQRVRLPEEARGERVEARRMLSTAALRRDRRDSLGDSKGPPSRGPSNKSILTGKSQRESAAAGGAQEVFLSPTEGSQTPGAVQKPPHHESISPEGLHTVEPSPCPPEEKAEGVSPSPSAESSLGAASPGRDPSLRSGLPPAETLEAILQKQNGELVRQNALMRQALLKHMSKRELLFLLAYNTTNISINAGDDVLRGPGHTPRGSTALNGCEKESGNNRGDEDQGGRIRHIDLPCVKDFFRAMRCCPGPPEEAPLQASGGGPETAAENSGPPKSLTTSTGHSATEETDEFIQIAVDFDPFNLREESNKGGQTPPVEAESGPSTMPSATTSTSRQRRSSEDSSAVALPALSFGRPPHRPASLGTLDAAPSHVKARAARGSMFYPSPYRLAALLPQPPPS